MDAANSDIIASLLLQSGGAALRIDGSRHISAVYNPQLIDSWMEPLADAASAVDVGLSATLQRLFAAQPAAALLQRLDAIATDKGCTVYDLGVLPLSASQYGLSPRHLGLSAQRLPTVAASVLLLLRDVTTAHELQHAVIRAQAAADTNLSLLRVAPDTIRVFLGSAMAALSALRATQRMPARTFAALRDKLANLQSGTQALLHEAQTVQLASIAAACSSLLETLDRLQHNPGISGNDLLPIAPLIDRIAHAVGNTWRSEEQRYGEPPPAAASPRTAADQQSRKHANWPHAVERRWSKSLRHRGEERGTLAKLAVSGAELVPAGIRRDIEELLEQLLRNALEHGIETPEQRLAADKPAAGQISVTFEDKGRAGLAITVRDDGRGLDLQRIGQAAVKCGLLTEESLLERDAGDLVGFIFKPTFTTACLGDSEGQGRGMNCLRNIVTRLNGQISVATKAGRYTQFNLQLPVGASLQEADIPAYG